MKFSIIFTTYVIPGVLVFASVVYAEEVAGVPGVDYPNYHSIPQTSFSCSEQKYIPGFYADLETQCQAFHFCFKDRKESFLCPTGTIFNQATLACDVWHASNCSLAPILYTVNAGPAVEAAGKNLPMLLKLRNRSQGIPIMTTPPPSVFEKISSLYESSADPMTMSEELEAFNFAGELEASNSNASDKSIEAFAAQSEVSQKEEERLPLEQDVEENEAYEDSDSMTEEIDEEPDLDSLYNPVTGGYHLGYDPYQTGWQDTEPVSDEFRNFYDYENRQHDYEAPFQGHAYSVGNEVGDESASEATDSGELGRDALLKRQLNVKQWQRKRPMYVVVEDEEDEKRASDSKDGALGDDPAASGATEVSTELPEESTAAVDGDSDSSEGPQVSEEVLRELAIPDSRRYELPFSTQRPLTADEFREVLIAELVANTDDSEDMQADSGMDSVAPQEEENYDSEDALTGFQRDQSVDVQYEASDADYESDLYDDAESERGLSSDVSTYEDSVDSFEESEAYEAEVSEGDPDDTLLVIPDESDAEVPDPDYEGDVNKVSSEEYDDEGYANEQPDVDDQSEQYAEYERAYGYYKTRGEFPDEAYEAVQPSYGSPEFDYGGPYGRQYIPHHMYGAGGYDPNVDYANYSPEQLAYLASLRNRDHYSYMQQQYQTGYTDPAYGAGTRYYQDDPYAAISQNCASDEECAYYTPTDSPWVQGASEEYGEEDQYEVTDTPWIQQHATEEYEGDDRLDVTGTPLPVDMTEADLITDAPLPLNVEEGIQDLEQISDAVEGDETPELVGDQKQDYYVFDFDEENELKDASSEGDSYYEPELKIDDELLEPDVNESEGDYADPLNLQETAQSEDLRESESLSNDNITIVKDGEQSSESNGVEGNVEQSLDELLSSQADFSGESNQAQGEAASKQPADSWSSFVTESNPADRPVTLSSAFERLAALNTAKPKRSGVNMDLSNDASYLNNVPFSESMDFGPYGYGAGMGHQFNAMNAMQQNQFGSFSHRTGGGGTEQGGIPKLSSIQDKIRSMKQGKFGVFKRLMAGQK